MSGIDMEQRKRKMCQHWNCRV